ncbi:MAG: saccharopine dehydrogenase NADP-binding domain-containing protein [Gammaproteobacteria bacterium]|nr:saccharopine dehydrogenase NADP-binding domain-containing protein [Gammaproteobacteria bacterium]
MRVVVIGCGFHGRGVAYELAAAPEVQSVVVVDKERAKAEAVAQKIRADWVQLEVQDTHSLSQALQGADLVFNAIGPYHYRRNALCVVEAALAAGVQYVDMNDDHEVAETLLLEPKWDRHASEVGIAMITGTGIAPGVTGMLAKLGYERMDHPRTIDVRFSWNYSLSYPAALHHFFRLNSGDAPQYIEGEYVRPGAFSGRERCTFLPPVGEKEIFYTGINDPVSISCSLPGLERVTARGAYHQSAANELLQSMVRWGFTSYESIPGSTESPFEFLMKYVSSDAGREYFDIPMENTPMAARVEVAGSHHGAPMRLVFEVQDFSRRATTSASARVALMLIRGEIAFSGMRAPEGCVDATAFLQGLAKHPDIKLFAWREGEQPAQLEF